MSNFCDKVSVNRHRYSQYSCSHSLLYVSHITITLLLQCIIEMFNEIKFKRLKMALIIYYIIFMTYYKVYTLSKDKYYWIKV